MGLRPKVLGRAVETVLQHGPKLRRGLHRRPRVDVYLQADDPHGYLLSQLVGPLCAQAGEDLRLHIVGPPAQDVEPEPDLRRAWEIADACLLSRYYSLTFPRQARQPRPGEVLLANQILLTERPTEEQLVVLQDVGGALWSGGDLEALATQYGRVPAADVPRRLASQTDALRRAGHYQGSMASYRGEWFWGVDRVDLLANRLGQGGQPRLRLRPEADQPGLEVEQALLQADGSLRVDLFFSFRSPYSYLALERSFALQERFDGVELRVLPVLPMVMRGLPVPRVKRLYIVEDAHREAQQLGIPFGRICDPVGEGVERCLACFELAARADKTRDFLLSAGRGIWSEALDMASDADLRSVVERAGLDWQEARAALQRQSWREQAEANRELLFELGLWGVPSYRVGGEVTWGQDRLPLLEHRIARALAARGTSAQ